MAQVKVDTARLRQTAGELRQQVNRLKNEASTMRSNQRSLTAQWDGDANTTFDNAFNRNVGEFQNFSNLILDYAAALDRYADDYERTERQNAQIASTR